MGNETKKDETKEIIISYTELIHRLILLALFTVGCYKYYYYGMEASFIYFIIGVWYKIGNDSKRIKDLLK